MPGTPAPKTLLRNEIIRILRQDIPFQVQDGDKGKPIAASAIVFQKTRAQVNRQDVQSNQISDIPGLLVCQPMKTDVPPNEGTNERDWWHYHWLIQLIDADLWSSQDRIATWDKWILQIISAFNFNCLQKSGVAEPIGVIISCVAYGVQDIDEARWVRDGKFIEGVVIDIRVQQPRGIIA